MSKGFCGKNCEVCGYYEICAGCWNPMCLLARCLRGTTFEGITSPRPFCTYRRICHRRAGVKIEFPPPPRLMKRRKQSKIDLPSFIPTIEISDSNSWFWPDVVRTAIIVRLGEILTDDKLKEEVSGKGLHDYLGFDGHIMLSTVMPDELLDRLTVDGLKVLIKDLQPDSCMVPDCYTYMDDPQLMSWQQLFKMLNQTQELSDQDMDIPVIGLVKGASRKQIIYCTERLLKVGLTTLAFPARELAEAKLLESFISNVTDVLQEKRADVDLIIYGLSYPIRRFPWRKTSYASMSWHIDSKYAYYYWNGLRYPAGHTSVRFNTCGCPGCKRRLAYQVASYPRDLAIHNLLELEERFTSNEEADK